MSPTSRAQGEITEWGQYSSYTAELTKSTIVSVLGPMSNNVEPINN